MGGLEYKEETLCSILKQSVFVDLEVHPETKKLLKIGAWLPSKNKKLYYGGYFNKKDALQALFEFMNESSFIIGHNIHKHDWPYLVELDKKFSYLNNKLIDTLVLNPLAFPENPYHHLVKDYKIQRESINDPVEDCKQTEKLFKDQCFGFLKTQELSGLYGRFLMPTSSAYKEIFHILLGSLPSNQQIRDYLAGHSFGTDKVCQHRLKPLLPSIAGKNSEQKRAFAYALAWLSIAGNNSVLPAWVRHGHPSLAAILDQLRNQDCGHSNCTYCKKHHHLETNLDQFFGYQQFRHFGQGDNPKNPLQRQIVASVCKAQATLAILPTGGGKSLCYQLPAMMLARNRGLLTLIISPLQSLMRDQVQQLNDKGYHFAAALNSSLNMPERHKVLEGIRMGDIHLLYIAPEQLRNTSFIDSIKSREIGQWIIDEAHCLSKWGHDFRPDYLYIGKFIKAFSEQHKQPVPAVHAFTATARQDVIKEIKDHFKKTLGMDMQLLSGGHARNNLSYQVLASLMSEKREKILDLLHTHRENIGDGGIVIFCNRRRVTEEMATFLSDNGWLADYFHAGRKPKEKKQVQQSFMDGEVKVMAATNAFGMGVDKSDIRLVIHAQMPDSLENYLQEAGRAGRDGKPAHCILLFNDDDADKQFEMRRNQQIEFRDFVSLFEAIRRKSKTSKNGDHDANIIQVSSGEILRHADSEDDLELGFDGRDYQADTKVRTAITWLEESGFLERKENKTGVIEGSFLINTKEKIVACLKQQKLSESNIRACLKVAMTVMQYSDNESVNADKIAEQTGMEAKDIFRKIRCLQDAKVMDHDMSLVAWLTARTKGDSKTALSHLMNLEKHLFALIQEKAQGEIEQDFHLNIHEACHQLREASEVKALPNDILLLLSVWGQLDRLIRVMPRGKDHFQIHWKKEFMDAEEYIRQRQLFSDISLSWLYEQVSKDEKGKNIRVPFKLGKLEKELSANILTRSFFQEEHSEKALLSLEKSNVLGLDSGAAIFHPAMTLHIPRNKRKPGKKAYQPLAEHYQAQIRQVHLMREWSALMEAKNEGHATQLLNDYFQLTEKELLTQYFPESASDLETSATPERVEAIIGSCVLSTVQGDIVQQSANKNMLVLAGPGSGKTRLLVHRVAWLVCVQRVKPKSILILAFNRSTVTELRRRLSKPQLLGTQAYFLEIHTYHSLAMRLLGEFPPENSDEFQNWSEKLISKAVVLLSSDIDDEDNELRRKIMSGFQHILVDEYQDINQAQYELLSAMAGRSLQAEEERLTMFAVGDDDQNIYEWNGAKNQYIQQFQTDYQASIEYMTDNYRSLPNIVNMSNAFIEQHPNRLKKNHPICAVATQKKGAEMGKVRLFTGFRLSLQTKLIEICNYLIRNHVEPNRIAILCREHDDYQNIASMMRHNKIPVCIIQSKENSLPWHQLREVHAMLSVFDETQSLSAKDIQQTWQALPKLVQQHSTTRELWDWLASYHKGDIIRSCLEWRAEIRELSYELGKKMGQGIHLGTIHSAKGLEFDSVIVFSGKQGQKNKKYEELRLRYVAMTRAERNLILMQADDHHPWFDSLPLKAEQLPEEVREQSEQHDTYACNMKDLNLDFAGQSLHPYDTKNIHVGDELTISSSKTSIKHQGKLIGKLSKHMHVQLKEQQGSGWCIVSIQVHAVLRRHKSDSQKGSFQDKCKQDSWDVIIPVFHLQKGGYIV